MFVCVFVLCICLANMTGKNARHERDTTILLQIHVQINNHYRNQVNWPCKHKRQVQQSCKVSYPMLIL